MANKGEKYRRLRDLFQDSFRPEELEIFLTENGYEEVVHAVNRSTAGAQYFFVVVQALHHRDLIDAEFFDRLSTERPKKKPQIESIARLWLNDPAVTGQPHDVSNGGRPERPPSPVEAPAPLPGQHPAPLPSPDAAQVARPPSGDSPRPSYRDSRTEELPEKAPGTARPEPPEFVNSIGMKLKLIPAGEFLMGSTKQQIDMLLKQFLVLERKWFDDEQPQHPVKITRSFYLAAHQVTVAQFRRFIESSGHRTDDKWRKPGFKQGEDHPVVCVSHDDALVFLGWLNQQEKKQARGYRLPTEAEWEYACRAHTGGLYGATDDPAEMDRVAWFSGNSGRAAHPVGQKDANAFGLYDMLGNVWDWCDDWFDPKFYQSSPKEEPRNDKKAPFRVIRGGSWIIHPWHCRPATRDSGTPGSRLFDFGFRVAAVQS
jgi:formylglycine-generating enzyme required for sulfatase activity